MDSFPWNRAKTEVENILCNGFFKVIKTSEAHRAVKNFKTKATVVAHLDSKRLEYLKKTITTK